MLYKHDNYINKNIPYISNNIIREYDMKEAGFNIIKYYELLDFETIQKIDEIPNKEDRTIFIGKLMGKNRNISKKLMQGFSDAREIFFEKNDIENKDVLSIKRDAIFLINKFPRYTKFNNIEFILKNRYSSYIRIDNIEYYYDSRNEKIDLKGLNNMDNHLLVLKIKYFLKLNELSNDKDLLFQELKEFRSLYLRRELELGYYKELNKNNKYKMNNEYNYVFLEEIDESLRYDIDIRYNYINIIIPLISVLI